MPMISAPLSARTLRIENMMSCLRRVEAPSTPSSSAMVTSSEGDFCLRSLRCIGNLFLVEAGALKQSEGAAGRCTIRRNGHRRREGLAEEPRESELWTWRARVNQRPGPIPLKWPDDDQHDDERDGDAGDFVHDPQRPVLERALARGERLAIGAEPALVAGQTDDQRQLGDEPALAECVE